MVVIGVVGGVASGKSLVAEQLRRLGAEVLDADAMGHEVLLDLEVKEAVRKRWGESVCGEVGEIDRKRFMGGTTQRDDVTLIVGKIR